MRVDEGQAETDAADANWVKVGEGSSIRSISTHNSSIITSSISGSNSSTSTRDSNSRTTINRAAAVEVVAGAGGGTHSSGELGAGDAAAEEALEGMQEVVRKQFGVGKQVYLCPPPPPLVGITVTHTRPTFPVQLIISPRYMQLTLASGARTATS